MCSIDVPGDEDYLEKPVFQRGGPRRSSKVHFQEMCKKFESLSSTDVPSSQIPSKTVVTAVNSETGAVPKAPLRRSKMVTNQEHGVFRLQKQSERKSMLEYSQRPISVRERTKIFESNNEEKKITAAYNNQKGESPRKKQTQNELSFKNNVSGTDVTPPCKPPRRVMNSSRKTPENGIKQRSFSTDESSLTDVEFRSSALQTSNQRKPTSSFSFDYESLNPVPSTPKLNVLHDEKPLHANKESTPFKQFKLQNLTAKLASAATNFREKVKLTHSRIFVDLTPTTVSPPKHYGTLKRSRSEEHIYAEPFKILNSSPDKEDSMRKQSLHYMSSEIIIPKVPDKLPEVESETVSVRNMIYYSFSMLRRNTPPTKDNPEVQQNTNQEDSDTDVSLKAVQDRIIYVKSVKKQTSASSICISPKLYDVLLIIGICDGKPEVMFSFPEKKPEGFDYPLLPHICFPDVHLLKCSSTYKSESFYFSLLDATDQLIYGYCLRILSLPPNSEKVCLQIPAAICILTSVSAPLFYGKVLDEIEKHLVLPKQKCFQYITSLRKLGVPNAGANLSIPDTTSVPKETSRVVITRPLDSHYVGCELTRCLQMLDVDVLVRAVASLLLERRVLLLSSFSSNLLHCCKALSSLLYPFQWQHLVIPILPTCILVQCCMESPYILGILRKDCNPVLDLLAEHELLIIDVDKGTVVKSCNDEDTILPKKVQKAVMVALNLSKNMTDPTETMRDVMISEAFVHMFVEMIGHYENHFSTVDGRLIVQKEAFHKGALTHSIRSFLQWFSETQLFDIFIAESIWRKHYRRIFQTDIEIFFEKRLEEYKWQILLDNDKISRVIGKKVKNFGEMLKGLKK